MSITDCEDFNIRDIINNEGIITHYHPIISIKKKSVVGYEALSRGFCGNRVELIPPGILFKSAADEKLLTNLDRLCRKKALTNFQNIHAKNKELLLFLNLDTSVMNRKIVGSGHLINMVNELHLDPHNIVIELVESQVSDNDSLERFIDTYRSYGFLIGLDDIGCRHSNLDRVCLAKPDMLKIDKSFISGIDQAFYKQEVLKLLVNLAKRIGALVVAEGIEREEEAVLALELGVDMLQGFYFSKPRLIDENNIGDLPNNSIDHIASRLQSHMVNKINTEKAKQRRFDQVTHDMLAQLASCSNSNYDQTLVELINRYQALECAYVLDRNGIQVSNTVCNYNQLSRHNRIIFHPAQKETDHSLKNYYYLLMNTGLTKYTTSPYISLASGNLCITMSALFRNTRNVLYIFCADFNQEYILVNNND